MARIDPVYHEGMPAKIGDVVLNQVVKIPSHQPDSVTASTLCVEWFVDVVLPKFAIDRIAYRYGICHGKGLHDLDRQILKSLPGSVRNIEQCCGHVAGECPVERPIEFHGSLVD